ncbi:aldolase [Lentinus tigrinus ALCF2SS1-7]|uniref:aldolase n=1 Tax=Lentinus tigrinus ALCF2SS1-7 TaxID=1328758 RepID=UPI001166088A|nr:aldolase [Lentinus tigrinus ALCF2SS1-7]
MPVTSLVKLDMPARERVKIVGAGPRDGLENESAVIPPAVKAELVNRLTNARLEIIESGSFVSPKWVAQMAGTPEVLKTMQRVKGLHCPVLSPSEFLYTDEIAVFTAATDAFSKANTNCTVAESLERLDVVLKRATKEGLRVRECIYVSVVDPVKVKDISHALLDMGWYEVSLSDTVGTGDPTTIAKLLRTGHYHHTYGMSIANILASLEYGLHMFDSSVGGLGGCLYSPGATGNVATEDVLYALRGSKYETPGDLNAIAEVGTWISKMLNWTNSSCVGKAHEVRRAREQLEKERERDGGSAESISAKL